MTWIEFLINEKRTYKGLKNKKNSSLSIKSCIYDNLFYKYYPNGFRQTDDIIETNKEDHPFFVPYQSTWIG